jgi:hypothetical protein
MDQGCPVRTNASGAGTTWGAQHLPLSRREYGYFLPPESLAGGGAAGVVVPELPAGC